MDASVLVFVSLLSFDLKNNKKKKHQVFFIICLVFCLTGPSSNSDVIVLLLLTEEKDRKFICLQSQNLCCSKLSTKYPTYLLFLKLWEIIWTLVDNVFVKFQFLSSGLYLMGAQPHNSQHNTT